LYPDGEFEGNVSIDSLSGASEDLFDAGTAPAYGRCNIEFQVFVNVWMIRRRIFPLTTNRC
jgi:hypothetical protein